ncbi:hypothetical protein H1C71_005161 [Ictidomys tridecemlineatus]|nr:hypothetical protein H1C71_005161 [Ictidomys tridecemlineatus]
MKTSFIGFPFAVVLLHLFSLDLHKVSGLRCLLHAEVSYISSTQISPKCLVKNRASQHNLSEACPMYHSTSYSPQLLSSATLPCHDGPPCLRPRAIEWAICG